jgi:hypothetical protein
VCWEARTINSGHVQKGDKLCSVGIMCRVHNGISVVVASIGDQRKCTVKTIGGPGTAADEGDHNGKKI